LTKLSCWSIFLTDNSWSSIAQEILKLPKIKEVELCELHQKHSGCVNITDEFEDLPFPEVDEIDDGEKPATVKGTANVHHFLEAFMQHFSTSLYYWKQERGRRSSRRDRGSTA
jgi:hypothetical protein